MILRNANFSLLFASTSSSIYDMCTFFASSQVNIVFISDFTISCSARNTINYTSSTYTKYAHGCSTTLGYLDYHDQPLKQHKRRTQAYDTITDAWIRHPPLVLPVLYNIHKCICTQPPPPRFASRIPQSCDTTCHVELATSQAPRGSVSKKLFFSLSLSTPTQNLTQNLTIWGTTPCGVQRRPAQVASLA